MNVCKSDFQLRDLHFNNVHQFLDFPHLEITIVIGA